MLVLETSLLRGRTVGAGALRLTAQFTAHAREGRHFAPYLVIILLANVTIRMASVFARKVILARTVQRSAPAFRNPVQGTGRVSLEKIKSRRVCVLPGFAAPTVR